MFTQGTLIVRIYHINAAQALGLIVTTRLPIHETIYVSRFWSTTITPLRRVMLFT